MGGFSILVELQREESAPAACAAGLLFNVNLSAAIFLAARGVGVLV